MNERAMNEALLRRQTAAVGQPELSHDAQQALDRLLRLNGADGLRAALLAMLLAPGHDRRLEAWFDETVTVRHADNVRADMGIIGPAALMPWFERVLQRLAQTPLAERRELLLAVRSLLTLPGPGRGIDRLLWLAVRRGFGELPWSPPRIVASESAAAGEARLPAASLPDVARFTAHLARSVPSEQAESLAGRDWYLAVMFRWQAPAEVPPWRPPDADAMVRALATLERLSWTERPLLVRSWVGEALAHSASEWLAPASADALRLACNLLDAPMPPELARHFITLSPDAPR
ncbi:MAG: hypothetical protein ABIO45_15995 [Burkholderiaceae bacterium]